MDKFSRVARVHGSSCEFASDADPVSTYVDSEGSGDDFEVDMRSRVDHSHPELHDRALVLARGGS